MQPGHGTDTTGWRQRCQQQWQLQVLPAGAAAAKECLSSYGHACDPDRPRVSARVARPVPGI